MNKYKRGHKKNISIFLDKCLFYAKVFYGIISKYNVHRKFVDHSVYLYDNYKLRTTSFSRAKIIHQVSMSSNHFYDQKHYIIEIEHPSALFGHLGETTNYMSWKSDLKNQIDEFLVPFKKSNSFIVCSSEKCLAELKILFKGTDFPFTNIRCIHWAVKSHKYLAKKVDKVSSVFHYAGKRPISKGTLDVLYAAEQLANIKFIIVIDFSLEICRELRNLPNIELVDLVSKGEYLKKLSESDVVICPTYLDGWGVYLDALSFNKPIISYNSYDKCEIVYHGYNGFLIEINESFYDNFFQSDWQNLNHFENFIEDMYMLNASQIVYYLRKYENESHLLGQHGYNSHCLANNKFNQRNRILELKRIYSQIILSE
jgi:glycosyltransferase involved in cell wall biosynthesis